MIFEDWEWNEIGMVLSAGVAAALFSVQLVIIVLASVGVLK